jgi:hypothetical protein
MADVIKVLGTELTLTTNAANTVSNATLVRLLNTSNDTIVTVTLQNTSSANIASFSLGYMGSDASLCHLKKEASDKLLASANSLVKAVAVGYY